MELALTTETLIIELLLVVSLVAIPGVLVTTVIASAIGAPSVNCSLNIPYFRQKKSKMRADDFQPRLNERERYLFQREMGLNGNR